jgi:hypothetical protein
MDFDSQRVVAFQLLFNRIHFFHLHSTSLLRRGQATPTTAARLLITHTFQAPIDASLCLSSQQHGGAVRQFALE